MQGDRDERGRGRHRGRRHAAPVWAREPRERRGRARATELSRADIVRAALEVADEQGHEAVSMRNVARRLGAGAMTLYSYVESKDDLLDLMFDEIMGELLIPEPLPDGWREALGAIARRTREVWLRHPWMASAGQRSSFGPNSMRHVEQSIAAIADLGLGTHESFLVLGAVDDYTLGFTMRQVVQQTALGSDEPSAVEWRAAMERYWEDMIATGDFPHLQAIAASDWEVATDVRFEQGLAWMLDGIAARHER